MEYIYEFCYNPCIYESSPVTVSIHKTKAGANKALKAHKLREKERYNELWKDYSGNYKPKFGENESWFIYKTKLLD